MSRSDPALLPVALPPAPPTAPLAAAHGVGLGQAARVWARIALLSFGGPAGQIAVMHRILVDERRWIGEARFLHALSFCTLLPGPEAQQLATYVGWLMHRTRGALLAGLLFVLPGVVSLMALSWLYVLWGAVPAVEGLFLGLKAAVLAVVVQAVLRVGGRALKGAVPVALALAAFLALALFAVPFPAVVLTAGVVGWLGARAGWHGLAPAAPGAGGDAGLLGEGTPDHARPDARRAWRTAALWLAIWLAPVGLVALADPGGVFARIGVFFSQMAMVTFGGAYAVLAYVAQAAVETEGWLRPGQMLDGLGLAESTPGPLIMVLQFVGFLAAHGRPGGLDPLLAGTLGGLLATWVTFAPCFLWILVGAPYAEALRGHAALSGALAAITAAVVGVIAQLALWFALHTLFAAVAPWRLGPLALDLPDPASLRPAPLALALLAGGLLFGLRLGLAPTLALTAAAGVALRLSGLA